MSRANQDDQADRRHFPRLHAPVYYESPRFLRPRRKVVDISMGGVRIFSDEPLKPGEPLTMELFLPDGEPVRAHARVAWISELPDDAPAKYDVGLQLEALPEPARTRLANALAKDTILP